MGTFSITEKLTHPKKFACMVSFNGKAAQYYEIDLPVPDCSGHADEAACTAECFAAFPGKVKETLQAVADQAVLMSDMSDTEIATSTVKIDAKGQVILK